MSHSEVEDAPVSVRFRKYALPLWGALLFCVAVGALYFNLRGLSPHAVRAALESVPRSTLVTGALVTLWAYVVIIGYDVMALAYVGKPQPLRRAALASFTSWAFCNTVGYALLSGGVMRYRIYARHGLSTAEIAQIAIFCSASAVLGLFEVGGMGLVLGHASAALGLSIYAMGMCLLGLALMALPLAYVFAAGRLAAVPEFADNLPPLPAFRIRSGQFVLGCVDFCSTCWVLYVLLPPSMHISVLAFGGAYVMAVLFGEASQVPGGLGILDAALFMLLKPFGPPDQLAAALLLYRVFYFLVPLALAAVLLGLYELHGLLRPASR